MEWEVSKSARKSKLRALRSPAAWTGGAGGAESSIVLAERQRVRVTKAGEDEVGVDIAQVQGYGG